MIRFSDITFAYAKGATTLDGVSLDIAEGERVVVLGPNGSGKSTLARLANGLLLPHSGSITVDDIATTDEERAIELRSRVGLVAQDPESSIVATSVVDEVAFGPENLGLDRDEILARIDEALVAVGLSDKREREPHTLSGGQKQRLAIAGVLAMNPRYLVLDEPTSMLDPQGCAEVREIIAALQEKGHGLLHITHDLTDLNGADHAVVLCGGRIVFEGDPEKLLRKERELREYNLEVPRIIKLVTSLLETKPQITLPRDPFDPKQVVDACVGVEKRGDVVQAQPTAEASFDVGVQSPATQSVDSQPPDPQATLGLLVARDVHYTYQPNSSLSERALSGVSLEVKSGEVTLMMGATGSGKSTLLRLLAGLMEPTQGSVDLDGVPVKPAQVGIVFQQPETQLFAETVLADVMFGPKNLGMSDDEAARVAREALDLVGLDVETFSERSPFALSGGEARKAAIAGIIAMKPRTILLDEPTAGLDWEGREAIRTLILSLQQQGTGIVIVSHSAEDFLELADCIVLLAKAEEIFYGDASKIIGAPQILAEAGIKVPPLLEIQMELRRRGFRVPRFSTRTSDVLATLKEVCDG